MSTHPQRMLTCRQGFSLVEIAIVLVIIGLLVGGLTAGQYVIRAAEINSVITDMGKYRAAYTQFKSQYNGMPGDLQDAEANWGTDPNGCPSNTNYTPRKETCNGNGDNQISTAESFRAWQHLAAAGLISGRYSGVPGPAGTSDGDIGVNVPAARPTQTGFTIYYGGIFADNTDARYYQGSYRTILQFGKRLAGYYPRGAALKPSEALEIDDKLDDMMPGYGTIKAMKSGTSPNCATTDVPSTAHYNATYSEPACALLSILQE